MSRSHFHRVKTGSWQVFLLVLALLAMSVPFAPASLAEDDEDAERYLAQYQTTQQSGGNVKAFQTQAQGQSQARQPLAPKQLIFVSDGMRPDIVERYTRSGDMPNYARFFNNGVVGENGMVNQVASNTGAGWATLSTGSWSGTHGQVNNTYHINSNGILTSTAGFDATRTQAEAYQEALEKQGKKVAMIEWPGALPARIKGPVVDFRNFYSSRGVVANYAVPGARPDASLVYTSGLQIRDAEGWTGAPPSFSPAKETSFQLRTNPIANTVVTLTFPIYIFDTTNDGVDNYDKVFITKQIKDASQAVADLKQGDWKDVKLSLPQNGLLVGTYMKLIDLTPDLSRFRLYFTSLARIRANLPDLEQKLALDFPTSTAADFAPLQAGIIDAQTYIEQGLKWYDTFSRAHEYIIRTYSPDVVMAGYPVSDEFKHQFLALATPSYTGPRTVNVSQAQAEEYIKSAYRQADTVLGRLWELLGGQQNVTTFVGADHGFAPTWKAVNANLVLQQAGLYDPQNRGRSQAVAYWAGGTANVYINLANREIGGVVTTTDYIKVRDQIMTAFNNLTDGGNKVVSTVLTKEQARTIKADGYTVNALHPTRTGDVVVFTQPPYQFDAFSSSQPVADAPFYGQHGFLPDVVDLSRNINLHGMFGMLGPGIAQSKRLKNPAVIDVIPSAAYAMGVPAPRFAEGRVLREGFTGEIANAVPVQVLAWSDYHGQLDPVQARVDNLNVNSGGVAYIGTLWKEARAENPDGTIILSDGDNVGATPPNSAFLNDEPTINAMNELGFTASAAGNHEFDKGVAGFQRLSGLAKFAYLANNIVDANTGQIAPFAKPYIIVKANGIDVGIIGVSNPETPNVTSPQAIRGYRWVDPVEPTNRYVQELVGKGVKTIIVVYHQGSKSGDFDNVDGLFGELARQLDPEVDMLLGGHTRVKTMTRVGNLLVSAANHALETSEVTLLVDPQTKNVVWSWGAFRRPLNTGVTPDPALAALVKQASDTIKPTLSEQVGTAAALVDRSRGRESKMGNLVSDALRAQYQVDVALQNSGGLRADFNPGPITKGDVFAVLPFGNLAVTGKIKGSDLLAALENGVADVSGSAGQFVQLSGLRIAYDASKPVGQRILYAVLSDGRPVDPNGTYTLATNDFMQVGGDRYTALTRMTEVNSREQLWEVAANYVRSLGTVNPQVEGRIVAAQPGQPAPTPPAATTPVLPTPASILATAAPAQATGVVTGTATAGPTSTTVPFPTQRPGSMDVTATPAAFPGMPRSGTGDGLPWIAPAVIIALVALFIGFVFARRRFVR